MGYRQRHDPNDDCTTGSGGATDVSSAERMIREEGREEGRKSEGGDKKRSGGGLFGWLFGGNSTSRSGRGGGNTENM